MLAACGDSHAGGIRPTAPRRAGRHCAGAPAGYRSTCTADGRGVRVVSLSGLDKLRSHWTMHCGDPPVRPLYLARSRTINERVVSRPLSIFAPGHQCRVGVGRSTDRGLLTRHTLGPSAAIRLAGAGTGFDSRPRKGGSTLDDPGKGRSLPCRLCISERPGNAGVRTPRGD
jgi:hypothetical protein